MLLTTIMNWTSETARLTDRQNEYYTTADAAEAATEKILTIFPLTTSRAANRAS